MTLVTVGNMSIVLLFSLLEYDFLTSSSCSETLYFDQKVKEGVVKGKD